MKKRKNMLVGVGCAVLAALCIAMSCNTGVYISVGEKGRNVRIEVDSAMNVRMELMNDSIMKYGE